MPKLTVAAVRAAKHSGRATGQGKQRPERIGDGDGLYLQVTPDGGKSWLFRYTLAGKAREMGLGSAGDPPAGVSLAQARDLAREARGLLRQGTDPIEARRKAEADAAAEAQAAEIRGKPFRAVTDLYLAAHEAGWRNAKHRAQWTATLESYAYPHFGDRPVAEVDTAAVMAALGPIWAVKAETASRVRGRIESVLDYATARGWRKGENPARWRGHLANLLPKRSKVARVEHHAALPWREVGAFMVALRQREGSAARALEFAILTAARTGEVIGARWSEVDMAAAVWTVPGDRMKAGREHRVPLSSAAMDVLRKMAALREAGAGDGWIFPGQRLGTPLSSMAMLMLLRRMKRDDLTAHGFRSTFRDWCAEATNFPRELAEKALAHVLGDKVEAAYQRGDLLERRVKLMEAWAGFCARPMKAGEVVRLRA